MIDILPALHALQLAIPAPPVCPSTIVNATGTFYWKCIFKYIPPQPLDIRYWWAGFTVTLIIAFLILGFAVSRGIAIGSTPFIYIMLIGLFVGSLVATLLTIMTWILPVTIFVALIGYAWRTRS